MNTGTTVTMLAYAAIFFVAGYFFGQARAERAIRRERAALESGRMTASLPIDADDAAAALSMLSDLVRKVEAERAQREGATA